MGIRRVRSYKVDERAPRELKNKLLKYLKNGGGPTKLPLRLSERFTYEDGFFTYLEKKTGPLFDRYELPLPEKPAPRTHAPKIHEKKEYLIKSPEYFDEDKKTVLKALEKIGVSENSRKDILGMFNEICQGKTILFYIDSGYMTIKIHPTGGNIKDIRISFDSINVTLLDEVNDREFMVKIDRYNEGSFQFLSLLIKRALYSEDIAFMLKNRTKLEEKL